MNSIFPASKRFRAILACLVLYLAGLLLVPTGLQAEEVATTVDTKSIHYPSMFVGQVWVRSGEASPPGRDAGDGRLTTQKQENALSHLKTDSDGNGAKSEKKTPPAVTPGKGELKTDVKKETDPEAIRKLKERRLRNLQALEKRKANKAALGVPAGAREKERTKESEKPAEGKTEKSDAKAAGVAAAAGKEKETPAEGKTLQMKTAAASASAAELTLTKAGRSGKNWHHKQDLYDVECGQRLARVVATYYFDRNETLVASKIHPDDQWYHIYPGSLEEKLFIEVCRPTIPTVRR